MIYIFTFSPIQTRQSQFATLVRCVEERFMGVQHAEMWSFVEHPEEVIPMIKKTDDWSSDAIKFAAVQ